MKKTTHTTSHVTQYVTQHAPQHTTWCVAAAGLSLLALSGGTLSAQHDSTFAQMNAAYKPWDTAQAWTPPVPSTPWDSSGSGWRGRLVVGEYTTGIFCGFCQIHDVAFDALLQRYPATAFIPLAYHYYPNLPLGDPADSTLELKEKWYGFGTKRGLVTPTKDASNASEWIDGRKPVAKQVATQAGEPGIRSQMYVHLARAIDAELQRPPEAFFQVQTRVTGGTVQVHVQVDSIVGRHPATYLRLLLVEDTVSLVHPLYWYNELGKKIGYDHKALRREHHMVVRAVAHEPAVPWGLSLSHAGTVTSPVTYTFDVAAIQRRALGYRTQGVSAMQGYDPEYFSDTANVNMTTQILGMFPDARDWRIDPRRLHVVAFVQDAHTGEVLQSTMVSVPPGLQLP